MDFKLPPIDSALLSLTGRSKGVSGMPAVTNPIRRTEGGGLVSSIAAQNRELTPKYLDTESKGSISLNGGYGRSEFGAFKPYLA